MTIAEPPFSDPVRLNHIGLGVKRTLTPEAAVRERIAASLDLLALDRFQADMDLVPTAGGWRLSGRVSADVVQACSVTLEPLPETVNETFSIELAEADENMPADVELTLDDDAPDYIEGGAVDLGVYAVEQLALALDPFPRKPGAVFEAPLDEAEPSPFAVLRKLSDKADGQGG